MTGIHGGLSPSFSCKKTTGPLTEIVSNLASDIERIKQERNIKGNEGEYYSVTASIKNDSSYDATDINIKLNILLTCLDETQFSIDHSSSLPDIKRGNTLEINMFDSSGCSEGLITLLGFTYKMNGSTPLLPHINESHLININELNNAFNGYRNYEEMQTSILLQTYIMHAFSARGVLLKLTLNDLTQLNKDKGFEYDGERYSFGETQLAVIRSMIQIDIIAKIMMYIEDLIILLEAIRESNGNYYYLLDKRYSHYQEDDLDVGARICRFFK